MNSLTEMSKNETIWLLAFTGDLITKVEQWATLISSNLASLLVSVIFSEYEPNLC